MLAEAPGRLASLYSHDPCIRPFPHYSLTRRSGLVELLLRGKMLPHLGRLRKADLFVLGGGGLVQDANGVGNLVKYLDDCLMAEWMGTPSILFGIGVGPLVTARGKRIARFICSRLSAITARDRDGAKVLADLGVTSPLPEATADPALLLEPATASKPEVEQLMETLMARGRYVVVCPRPRTTWSQLSDAEWNRLLEEMATLCDGVRTSLQADIVFVPFMGEDKEVVGQIRSRMKSTQGVFELTEPPVPRDGLRLIASARFVLGMRLHSLIFAASQAVPMISVNYAPKVGSFAAEIDKEGVTFTERDIRAAPALDALQRWEAQYESRRASLRAQVEPRKAAARLNFDRALALIR